MTLEEFKLKEYRKLLKETKERINTILANRATANQCTLGFLDALEEKYEQELETLKRKIRMCKPQKVSSIGGITAQDIARAKLSPISNYLKVPASKKVNCLFHNDKVASMHVYPDGVHCFSCQHHTDTIGVVMKLYNLKFTDAVKKLACV